MARLFITPREISFSNDIMKELIKDVAGQAVNYYSVSAVKTNINIYDEAPEKVFDHPVKIDCLVEINPQQEVRTNEFGYETYYTIKAYVQSRDLLDKNLVLLPGDFFTYGEIFFEVTSIINMKNLFGQVEYNDGLEMTGKQSRKSNFVSKIFGPTNESLKDADAVQKNFYQQRGFENNANGPTNDKRELQANGTLDAPLAKSEISVIGASGSNGPSSFYDEIS